MNNLRMYQIVDFLKEKKYCSVADLMAKFKVSSATIHRDIAILTNRSVIRKVHGGVAFQESRGVPHSPNMSSPYLERLNHNRVQKQLLAAKAMERICEGDILFLDSSTTVAYLAELLETGNFSNLSIVTNSVTIQQNFHKYPPHFVLIGLGGSYDIQLNAFLGQSAIRELEQLSISKAFISAFGVSDEVVSTNHEHHAVLLQKVIANADQKFLMADKDKFNRNGLFKFATTHAFDEILTNGR